MLSLQFPLLSDVLNATQINATNIEDGNIVSCAHDDIICLGGFLFSAIKITAQRQLELAYDSIVAKYQATASVNVQRNLELAHSSILLHFHAGISCAQRKYLNVSNAVKTANVDGAIQRKLGSAHDSVKALLQAGVARSQQIYTSVATAAAAATKSFAASNNKNNNSRASSQPMNRNVVSKPSSTQSVGQQDYSSAAPSSRKPDSDHSRDGVQSLSGRSSPAVRSCSDPTASYDCGLQHQSEFETMKVRKMKVSRPDSDSTFVHYDSTGRPGNHRVGVRQRHSVHDSAQTKIQVNPIVDPVPSTRDDGSFDDFISVAETLRMLLSLVVLCIKCITVCIPLCTMAYLFLRFILYETLYAVFVDMYFTYMKISRSSNWRSRNGDSFYLLKVWRRAALDMGTVGQISYVDMVPLLYKNLPLDERHFDKLRQFHENGMGQMVDFASSKRKVLFAFHNDRLPKHFTEEQREVCNSVFQLLNAAYGPPKEKGSTFHYNTGNSLSIRMFHSKFAEAWKQGPDYTE